MSAADKQQDLEWVQQTLAGDLSAFDELVQKYQGKLYSLAYNMTSNADDANDIVQEAFVKAYRSLNKFKQKSAFYTWLYRIAVNTAINCLKKRKRRAMASFDNMDAGVERDGDYLELVARDTPLRDTKLSELQEKLNRALQTLSEKHRMVVVMHDIEGMEHEDIARIMKCSSGTVRSRLFYARKLLQAELQEFVK